jgi:hypothetical protein
MFTDEMNKILANMSPEERNVVDAIRAANNMDEKGVIDNIIKDVKERRGRFFDLIYVDLSIDRSTTPLQISGAGTFLACIEATDSAANATISFEVEDGDTNRRFVFKSGKRIRAPYASFYIYHTAQAGKTMKIMRGFDTRSLLVGFEDNSSDASTANLETALANSTAIVTNQVSVDNAGNDQIRPINLNRKRVTIKVPVTATEAVFIGITGVSAANGHRLDPGDAITLNTTAAIHAITAGAGPVVVTYLEE